MKRRSSQRLQESPSKKKGEKSVFERSLERFQTADGRGWGVRTKVLIPKRSDVVSYNGELLNAKQASEREKLYEDRGDAHSYMFWFHAMDTHFCLDATSSVHISRFINHSRKRPNLIPRLVMVDGSPKIIFRALVELEPGTELLFDYGDTRPAIVAAHPWLLE